MIFSYNNFDLAQLGDLALKQKREFDGSETEAPQRAKVTLNVTVNLFERSFDANYQLVQQARAALAQPNANLQWQNTDTQEDYVNQTATLTAEDLPEEWGQYHQQINLTFEYYEALDTSAQNLPLVFTPDGGQALSFDNVMKWTENASVSRFDPKRKQRRETQGRLAVSGLILGDTTQPLATRRAALAALVAKYRTAMNSAQGKLAFGPPSQEMFNGSVRVQDFAAQVNQAICAIEFSFAAEYTLFPDEMNYAMVEAVFEEKDTENTGDVALTASGKVQASNEAAARAKLKTVIAALLAQRGYNAGQKLEFTATPNLISANSDGDTFTELTFNGQWRKWKRSNQQATFKKTGGGAPVPFGNVKLWDRSYRAERFDEHRSQRRHATGGVSGAGTWSANPGQSLADRRTQLLAQERLMYAEINGADGALAYGDETLTVRIVDFTAKVNQAETGIDWTFTAEYSLFPNEGGYATCAFTAESRDDVESGDRVLIFNGAIEAPTGALARAKLAALRGTTLAIYGFKAAQKTRGGSAAHAVSANGDATAGIKEGLETAGDEADTTFLRLTFNEEYRQRIPGSIVSSQYQMSSRDDTATGLALTTFSGWVTATGPTPDAALAAAIARAMVLGANQEKTLDPAAFLKASSLTFEKRQLTADNPEEFLRLQFSYEYQSKVQAGRAYLELNTAVTQESFGADSETASGAIVARDFATANTLYLQRVKALYAGRLIRNETVTQSQVQAEGAAFRAQQLRLEFSFTAHRNKPAGRVTARYAISVSRDFRALVKKSTLKGSVFALDAATADGWLTLFLDGYNLGSNMMSERNEDHEYTPDGPGIDVLVKLDFEEAFEARLTGVTGVIEMKLTESVTYSSTRWAPQPIPFDDNGGGGVTLVQPAGIAEGSRSVRGSVTAATLPTAQAWAWRQRSLLTGDANGNSYPTPPQMENDYEFQPRVDGIAQGDSANVQLYRVNFSFGEILPNYPAPV